MTEHNIYRMMKYMVTRQATGLSSFQTFMTTDTPRYVIQIFISAQMAVGSHGC